MEMEYGRALSFPTQSANWLMKWAIAGLLMLVPVLGWLLVAGYSVEIARRVINGDPDPLPEWNDFGNFLFKGLGNWAIRLVYFLPLILLAFCAAVPLVGVAIAQANGADTSTLQSISNYVGWCLGCVGALYGVVGGMVVEAALGQYAATNQIGAALRVGEVLGMVRARPGLYLLILVIAGIASSLLSSLGVVACGIGAFFGAAYAAFIAGHLQGQAYRYYRHIISQTE